MTLTDELKILDDKIKANQAQYDLGREAAKIAALSSKDLLEKYEYLTGEDLKLMKQETQLKKERIIKVVDELFTKNIKMLTKIIMTMTMS